MPKPPPAATPPLMRRREAMVATASLALAPQAWAQPAAAASAAPAEDFDAWSETYAADWVRLSAERATFTQYFSGAEQAAFDRQLTPQTPERRARQRALAAAGLARVRAFEAGTLTEIQRVGAATMRWSLQRNLAEEPFEDHNFAFNQLRGPQVQLVSFMSEAHPMRRPTDVAAYVERLSQVPTRVDEVLQRSRAAVARGLLPPRFIVERSLAQVRDFLAPPPAQNLFVTALERRSARVEGLAADDRGKVVAQAVKLVDEQVRPAWQRIAAMLEDLLPRTHADAGLWRLPDGAAAYAQALATYTTTSYTADEIHAIGLREVARIEGEMDRVLKSIGRSQGSVKARYDALNAELQPPADPDPRPLLIQRHAEYVRDNQRRSQALFNLQPRAPVEVRREPALTEKTAAAHYNSPAPDGSRPGVFFAPLPGPVFEVARMRSLAVHEAVPGHHYQIALQMELPELPRWRQRRIFGGGSANSEGWALYAERLAIDHGWYEGDPHALLGALDSQLFRARRLVVDTGLHSKRWTREQAIAYGIGAQEVERYVSNPGQACAYMIGMLRLLSSRDEAQAALKDRFRIQDFHDVVLKAGSVPLDVLGEVVQRWARAA